MLNEKYYTCNFSPLIQYNFSQNTGTINGRIIDIKSQLPLEGATIILSGTTYGTVTNNEGYFFLENIPSNTYNIIVSFWVMKPKLNIM